MCSNQLKIIIVLSILQHIFGNEMTKMVNIKHFNCINAMNFEVMD